MNAMINGALNLFRGLNADEPVQAVNIDELLAELRAEFAVLGADIAVDAAVQRTDPGSAASIETLSDEPLANAVKYGVRASVAVEHDGAEVVVRVLDEGPGIPEEMLEQVFEPFLSPRELPQRRYWRYRPGTQHRTRRRTGAWRLARAAQSIAARPRSDLAPTPRLHFVTIAYSPQVAAPLDCPARTIWRTTTCEPSNPFF